jgi:hypothetical protein
MRHHVRLDGFREVADGVEATLVDTRSGARRVVRADYLVACDGYRSAVRDSLGIAMRGRDPVDKSVNLMVRIPRLADFHDKGNAGRYILVGEIGTWATFVAVDGRELWRITLYGSDQFDPYAADHHAWIKRALGCDIDYELLNVERWTRRAMVADRYASGRVFLAGDAVHAMPPNGGFGMNTGIGDAADLGWKLAAVHHGWGGAGLLSSYEIERRPVGARAVAEALRDYDRLTSNTRFPAIAEESPAGEAIRRDLGARLGAANRRAWEPIGIHLGYRYDPSPIVVDDGTPPPEDDEMAYAPSARPGSRAPHAWCADGRSTLDLFGRKFTLLSLGRDGAAAATLAEAATARGLPLDVVFRAEPDIADLYRAPLVLVRPDGHVAWRGKGAANPGAIIDTVRGVPASAL